MPEIPLIYAFYDNTIEKIYVFDSEANYWNMQNNNLKYINSLEKNPSDACYK